MIFDKSPWSVRRMCRGPWDSVNWFRWAGAVHLWKTTQVHADDVVPEAFDAKYDALFPMKFSTRFLFHKEMDAIGALVSRFPSHAGG